MDVRRATVQAVTGSTCRVQCAAPRDHFYLDGVAITDSIPLGDPAQNGNVLKVGDPVVIVQTGTTWAVVARLHP